VDLLLLQLLLLGLCICNIRALPSRQADVLVEQVCDSVARQW